MERKKMGIIMVRKINFVLVMFVTFLYSGTSVAGTLSVPNSFSSGSTTSAADMNSNFSAVATAVNDNDTRITALEASSAPVFQGFSSGTVDGGDGVFALAQACSASFSGSKICNSDELVNSVYNSSASNLSGLAWLLPRLSTGDTQSTELNSGRENGNPWETFSCRGWGSDSNAYTGTVVSSVGELTIRGCDNSYPVACCK
jgi:hypothetical protein